MHSVEKLSKVYHRTNGRCHICRVTLRAGGYGELTPGGWEVDHSKPKSKGGTDRVNNLFAACPSCNRSRGNRCVRATRAEAGYTRSPLSSAKANQARAQNGIVGSLGVGALGFALLGPAAFVPAAFSGFAFGHGSDPEAPHARVPAKRRRSARG